MASKTLFTRTVAATLGIHKRCFHGGIGVVGVPFNKGQPKSGVELGPQQLRQAGLLDKLHDLGNVVTDHGDLNFQSVPDDAPHDNIKSPRTLGSAFRKISDSVSSIVKSQQQGLVIGGDHSIAIGSVHGHGHSQNNMCLIWVDAHADLNSPSSSHSGNVHGMPLSFVIHEMQQYVPRLPGFEWIRPCLHAKDIVFIGLRDIDPAEKYFIEKLNITSYTMYDVDKYGLSKILEQTLSAVNPRLDRPIHLSFDIDALDPSVSASTGTPVAGGLTIREGKYIAEELANTGVLSVVDLVEVNPKLGSENDVKQTVKSAMDIISACFGEKREGTIPKDFKTPVPLKI